MDAVTQGKLDRKAVLLRFLLAVLFVLIFGLIRLVFQFTVLFQHVYMLIAAEPNMAVHRFSGRLAAYAAQVVRYATAHTGTRPFPFADFPSESETGENP
ncbi:MAG: DUF4389 domain-containing protein [Deltaproteobacteria bacterium]|nr:DUF4389 domain-containing protein [Deltaproteobacteria bacterium]